MTSSGDAVARRARSLVGTAYRTKGRGTEGLDCVGVAALSLAFPAAVVPQAYERRHNPLDLLGARLRSYGLEPCENVRPGDLLVFEAGLGRLHLAIATHAAFVHADAALGRVVERSFPAPWPVAGVWRLANTTEPERAAWQPSF